MLRFRITAHGKYPVSAAFKLTDRKAVTGVQGLVGRPAAAATLHGCQSVQSRPQATMLARGPVLTSSRQDTMCMHCQAAAMPVRWRHVRPCGDRGHETAHLGLREGERDGADQGGEAAEEHRVAGVAHRLLHALRAAGAAGRHELLGEVHAVVHRQPRGHDHVHHRHAAGKGGQ